MARFQEFPNDYLEIHLKLFYNSFL